MIRKKIVVAYLRLSVEDGDDKESSSISNQRRMIEKYAEENGLIISKFYIDDGYSGYKMDRPEFNMLKYDLNNNNVDVIIVKDLSRLGRHSAKVQLFLENILNDGKRIITLGDNYDTNKEETHSMAGIYAWLNEMQVKDTSRKVKNSLHALQREGKLLCNVPYGYYKNARDKTKCHVDHNIAPYVRQIFDMYTNGMGIKEIARVLSESNIPTPTMVKKQRQEADGQISKIKVSGIWDTSVIIKILKNEFYLGTLVLNKTKTRSIRGKKINTTPEEHLKFPDHHEAIIDAQTFRLAQELRNSRRCNHFRGQKSKVRKNLFAGIIYCADCGAILTTSGATSNTRYICKTYNVFGTSKCTNHAIMENDILEVLFDLLRDCRDNLQDVLADINNIIHAELKARGKKENNEYDLVKMLDSSKKALEVLIEMKMKEILKNPSMADIIDSTYNEMQNEKYKEIKMLEQQIADQQDVDIDEKQLKDDVNAALTIINKVLTSGEITKKQILMLVDKLVVYEDSGIDIYLKGNLHELSQNYFKVNETAMNKTKMYLYEYIANHQDKFTKDECTLYVKNKGVKTNYKIISRIINNELGNMVELREMRHGYRLTAPLQDVERVLLSNIVVGAKKCPHANDVKYSEQMEFIDNVVSQNRRLPLNQVTFALLTQISIWTQGLQPKNHRF